MRAMDGRKLVLIPREVGHTHTACGDTLADVSEPGDHSE